MRKRLVSCFVVFAVFILVTFGVVRAHSLTGLIEKDGAYKIDRSLASVSALINERTSSGKATNAQHLEAYLDDSNERIEYVTAEGTTFTAQSEAYDAGSSRYDLSRSAPVDGGGSVTLERSGAAMDKEISDALLSILWVVLALVGVAVVVGNALATRLSRPFQDLSRIAAELGRGDFDVEIPRFAIREADAVGRALQTSAIRLKELVRGEHEFAANASHQLRTPITAMHLVLEDLARWEETTPGVAEQLRLSVLELDRLSTAVTGLLDMARGKTAIIGPAIDVSELMTRAAERWHTQVNAAGRTIVATSSGSIMLRAPRGLVDQILEVLIENSLKHGAGAIELTTKEFKTFTRLSVQDQGKATMNHSVFGRRVRSSRGDGEGIGLSIAAELAAFMGGTLVIADEPTTVFDLTLPRQSHPSLIPVRPSRAT